MSSNEPDSTEKRERSASVRNASSATADAESTLLTVENLTRAYGDLTVLSNVSLTVDAGRVVCVVGPNGSGKTTLLQSIAGLLEPTEGHVEIQASSEREIGYLPQTPAFRPSFTVAETLAFYASLVETTVDISATLERVGLKDVRERPVGALSGGMVRLLGLAQATVGDPSLLVLDEPASGLDPHISHHIAAVIADLATNDRSVLLATHDLVAVSRIADTVVVLDRGEIVARGSPDEMLDSTSTDTLDDALEAILGQAGTEIAVQPGQTGGGDQ